MRWKLELLFTCKMKTKHLQIKDAKLTNSVLVVKRDQVQVPVATSFFSSPHQIPANICSYYFSCLLLL